MSRRITGDVSTRTIHPFPARMAPEIALSVIPEKTEERLTILDPMCGSGTVLSAAVTLGHRAIGIDIDPLAVMMSRVAVEPLRADELLSAGHAVLKHARRSKGRRPWGEDGETEEFVRYWFGPRQYAELVSLTSAIKRHATGALRLALQVAVSRMIITKSPQASLAADTSHSRPHRVLDSSDYDVYAGFERSYGQLVNRLAGRVRTGGARVILGDARDLAGIRDATIDLTVTSPPYLNALDYLRGHKLALVWFGYKVAELRNRRSTSIGSERNLESEVSEPVAALVALVEAMVVNPQGFKRGMVSRFAQDCTEFANQLARVVRPAGRAVLVVGNSTLRGNFIRNDLVAQLAMEHSGFKLSDRYERELPPNMRYMPISDSSASSITRRMRSEVVLVMENQ